MKKIITVIALVMLVSGCASQKATPTNTPIPPKTKTQAEIESDFFKIADDSCKKAQTENIIEEVADGSRIIVLAKDNAYKDYSAIYIDAAGKTQVIYEMELSVCAPGYLISMMEEANQTNSGDYKHSVKLNTDGTYTWSQRAWGEENVMQDTVYTATDGIITAADGEMYDYVFKYGPISDADMEIFRTAIDAELERLGN